MSGIVDPPIPKANDPISMRGKCRAVGRDQHSNTGATLLVKYVEDGAFRDGIDLPGRLICEKDTRSGSQSDGKARPCQSATPLMARNASAIPNMSDLC